MLWLGFGSGLAEADRSQPPDPPAATWNEPPPPGVETLKPSRPTWCAGYKPRPWLPGKLYYDDIRIGGYSEQVLRQVAELACDRPDDPGRQAWIAFYRQGWINIVGTTDQEDRAAMAARMVPGADKLFVESTCKKLWSDRDASPAERSFNALRAQAIGCSGLPSEITYGTDGGTGMAAASYWLDRSVEPPDELVRLAWVLRCLNPGASAIDPKTAHQGLGNYAFCGHDARKLDRATFERALAALKLPPIGQVRARERFAYTKKLLASYDRAFQLLASKDKDYARLAIHAPEQGFATWVKNRKANAVALDEARAMEDKFRDGDRKAVAGCGVSLRKHLKAHVASLAPKTKDDIVDAVNDDVGQPILAAVIACDSLEQRYGLVNTEMKLLSLGRTRRGPRTAAFWNTLDAVAEIVKDKTKFPVQPNRFGGPLPRVEGQDNWIHVAVDATVNKTSFDRDQKGQVAAVKPQSDGIMVSFRTESWQEPVFSCKDTNRIDRIMPDGRVEYRQSCVATGTQTVRDTPRPAWIRNDLADGIKPGVSLTMRVDGRPSPAQGFPIEVHADKARKRLIQYWGFPVVP